MKNIIFTLPALGENIEGGDLVSISVKAGDVVSENDIVCEVETDKASVEIPASHAGKVMEVFVSEGDSVLVGQNLFSVEAESGGGESSAAQKPAAASPAPEPAQEKPAAKASAGVEIKVPDLGGNEDDAASVISLSVKPGDRVSEGDIIVEVETDKATVEIPSELSGTVDKIQVGEGDEVRKGDTLLILCAEVAAEVAPEPEEEAAPPVPEEEPLTRPSAKLAPSAVPPPSDADSKKTAAFFDLVSEKRQLVPASPNTRRFAREIGIPIEEVPGSGPRGRITLEDVKRYSKTLHENNRSKKPAAVAGAIAPPPLPDFSKWGEVEHEKMSKIRQVTATHMANCWAQVPHVTQFDKADVHDLEKLRKKHKATAEADGAKLTMTAILLKAVALTLKHFPRFNSSLDLENNRVILKKYIHVGVAVDTPNGLIVPVIRNADEKNIVELAKDLGEISKKARDRKIAPEDLQGGTFTLSNLGGIGGSSFTPIVNWPQVAILGVSRGALEPIFDGERFVPRLTMPLSLSYDHRVIDGADGARFIRKLVSFLEDPFLMNLSG